jgi:Putative transposase
MRGVRCDADQRQGLEHLCRYFTRPAIANERLSVNRAGQVVLRLKTPWRNGTTHIVMSSMEFMQRLAALVPRPRLHLIRFHGVLAPNATLRSAVVPVPVQKATAGDADCTHAHSAPVRMTWAWLLKRVFDIDIEHCACGGKLKLIAVIEEPAVIEKILMHLGLSPQPPPREWARRVDLFGAD